MALESAICLTAADEGHILQMTVMHLADDA